MKKGYSGERRDRLITATHKTLSVMAFPAFAMTGGKNSGSIGMGLLLTVLAWPITLPAALVFGPICKAFHEHYAQRAHVRLTRHGRDPSDTDGT